ncbi:MAG: acyltransferase family protein [Oscillospiraceae bacterium]
MDLIRFLVILFVLSAHFFARVGYINAPIHGERYFIATAFREIITSCVPLFFMLSGYLMKNKTPVRSYYSKIIRLLVLFLVIGTMCNLYRIFVYHEQLSAVDWLFSFTNFSANTYSWYLKVYIGLFVLAPFLNMMIHALKSKKQFHILLLSLILVFSLPVFFGRIGLQVSNYWKDFYPITYYLLGAYISIYKPCLRKGVLIAGIFIVSVLGAVLLFLTRYGQKLGSAAVEYGDFLYLLITVMLFLLLYQVKAPRVHFLCRFVSSVSRVSYSMFLISWIYDRTIYGFILVPFVSSFYDRLLFIVLTVPAVFLLSYLSALVLEGSYNFVAAKGKQLFFKQTV